MTLEKKQLNVSGEKNRGFERLSRHRGSEVKLEAVP